MARSWLKSVSQWVLKVNLRAARRPDPAPQPLAQRQTRLMREPLGNQSCVKYAFVPNASGDHPITIFDLAGINVVDLFAAVLLADPPSRAVVMHGPLIRSTYLPNCQTGLIR